MVIFVFFFFQAEDGIRDLIVTGVQTCALPISPGTVGQRGQKSAGGSMVRSWRWVAVITHCSRKGCQRSSDTSVPFLAGGIHRCRRRRLLRPPGLIWEAVVDEPASVGKSDLTLVDVAVSLAHYRASLVSRTSQDS